MYFAKCSPNVYSSKRKKIYFKIFDVTESIVKFVSERQSLCDVRGELQVTLTIVKTAEHVSSEDTQ